MKQVGGFEIPLYKHAVKVFVGLPDDVPQHHAAHTEIFPDKQLVHIYIKDPNDFYVGYTMHECIHAADFILYAIGADMGCSPDDSEVRAYLAEYIYNKTAQALGYLKYKPRKLNKRISDETS